MELKKSPKADLQNKKKYFLQIGIIIALAIVIGLFSWSQSEKVIDQVGSQSEIVEQDVIEITVQEEKPKVEVVQTKTVTISEIINVVKNDAKITEDLSFLDDFSGDDFKIEFKATGPRKEEAVEEEAPVIRAEQMPKFGKSGGLDEFRDWCLKQIVYPQAAIDNGIQGNVVLSFVIEKDGTLTNIKVLRSRDRDLDAEAVRVLKSSPKWQPGKNRGKPVRVTYTLPINFQLH